MSSYQPALQIKEQIQQLKAIGKHLESICQQTQTLPEDAKYEKAYRSEQRKLQQSVAQCKKLELENGSLAQANTYYRNELIPSYDNVLQLQTQTLKDTEAQSLELKAKSRVLEEKHAQTLELLNKEHQKVDALQAEIQVLSEATPSHGPQSPAAMRKRLRSSRLVEDTPVRRVRKCRLDRPRQMKLGA